MDPLEALALLAHADAPVGAVWSPVLAQSLRQMCPVPATPGPDVVLPPDPPASLSWHVDRIDDLARADLAHAGAGVVAAARLRYHARMLGHALAPDRAEFKPLVTVLLPLFNRAGPVIEAVQSCIDQTWRPLEILVIDDGSTDHPEHGLARFGDRVRLVRKPNGGVASARNLGRSLAEGDFIQLLDSDDVLCPRAIEDKIAAFLAVPDADLCYGQTHWADMRVDPPTHSAIEMREHVNPRRTMIVDFAFNVPSVLMPRWRMLAMPPFEEDLTRASDLRFWQQLAIANIKVMGLRSEVAITRRFEHSLQTTPHPKDDSHLVCVLRTLMDLVRCPDAWPYIHEYMGLFLSRRYRHQLTGDPSPRVAALMAELRALLAAGGVTHRSGALSLLPILAAMRSHIGKMQRNALWPTQHDNSSCVYASMERMLAEAIATAAPIGLGDIAFWSGPPDRLHRDGRLERFFSILAKHCPARRAPQFADAILRNAPALPNRRDTRRGARWAWLTGSRLAARIAMAAS